MKKVFYLLCLSALFLPAVSWAIDGNAPAHKGPNTAIKKYIKETVMPVLIQKRQQFDRELTAAEKNEITECKAALKQLQSQHHEHQWNHDPKGAEDNKPAPDFNRAQHQQNPDFEQHKAIMERLQAIADKHSNSLQDIKIQLEPVRKQWVEDIKKLQPATDNAKQDNYYHGERHMEHGPEAFLYPHHLAAVHFLLLPVTPEEDVQRELKSDNVEPAQAVSAAPVTTTLTNFEVMPNPAANDVQLGNDILPATNQLKIFDLQGKELLSLENVQAAQHLDVSQFANGTYLIQIKSGNQVVGKKVVVSR